MKLVPPFDRGIGAISAVFATACLAALIWLMLEPQLSLVSAPVVVVSGGLAATALVLFLVNAGATTGAVLIGITFGVVDLTLRKYGASGSQVVDPQTILKFLFYLVLLVYSLWHGSRWVLKDWGVGILVVYSLCALASAIYSTTPLLAVGGGLALLAVTLTAGVVANWTPHDVARAWAFLFISCLLIGVASLLLYAYHPSAAVAVRVAGSGRLSGVTGAPNSLGHIAALGIIVGLYVAATAVNGRWRAGVIVGLLVLCLVLTLTWSRTALLALVFAIGLSHILRSRWGVWILLAACAIVALIGAYPAMVGAFGERIAAVLSRTGSTTEITTFTGRVEIWRASFRLWLESPWIGYGLGSPRTVIPEGWTNRWGGTTGTAHNVVLESLLSLGLVGTLPLMLALLSVGLRVLKGWMAATSGSMSLWWVSVTSLAFVVISGLMEKSFGGTLSPNMVMLSLVCGTVVALHRSASPSEVHRPT